MNFEDLIPEDYGRLENSDLALSEGRIKRLFRENMDEEQTLDGDVPHVVNCVLSSLLDEIIDATMDEAEYMAKVKESHLRVALRNIEIEEEMNARTEAFIDQLRSISDEMAETADRIEEQA
jgi:histone H3/H4